MNYIEINAPAKINLGLNIVSKRDDGYRNLETLFYPLTEISDLLVFEKSDSFSFECDNVEISNPNDNLVVKAVELISQFTDKRLNVKIKIAKKIPMGAGLGGGSSDAAATLISINELFSIGLKYEKLIDLALELGSDVPFFIKAKPAIGTSRGEKLKFVDLEIDKPILIVNPGIHVSTKEAFSKITPKPSNVDYNEFIVNGKLNWPIVNKSMVNDFEKNVFELHPEINDVKNIMQKNNSIYAQMSGSGSTVFGIFNTIDEAEKVKELMPANYLSIINHTS